MCGLFAYLAGICYARCEDGSGLERVLARKGRKMWWDVAARVCMFCGASVTFVLIEQVTWRVAGWQDGCRWWEKRTLSDFCWNSETEIVFEKGGA